MHQTREVYGAEAALLVHMQRNIHVKQVEAEQSPISFEMHAWKQVPLRRYQSV
jgi:hypothetical protein